MKKIRLIFLNTLRRSKMIFLIAFACGLALCFIFNLMAELEGNYYDGIPVGFLAREETCITQDLRAYLSDELGMELLESDDIDYLNTELVERRISAVVEVPEGFEHALLSGGEPSSILLSYLDDYANAAFVEGYLESYSSSLSILASGADGNASALQAMLADVKSGMPPVETEVASGTTLKELTEQGAFRQVLGFYLMFSFLLALSAAFFLFDDRKNGVYNRVKTTGVRSAEYISGTCAVSLISAILLIGPFFVYIAITQPSTGIETYQAVILCLLYALFVISVSLAVSLYFKTKNAVTAAIIATATITCLLGGAYFPITTSPLFLQKLARATPQFWFMDAVKSLQAGAGDNWLLDSLVIALFAAFFLILAGIRFVDAKRIRRS